MKWSEKGTDIVYQYHKANHRSFHLWTWNLKKVNWRLLMICITSKWRKRVHIKTKRTKTLICHWRSKAKKGRKRFMISGWIYSNWRRKWDSLDKTRQVWALTRYSQRGRKRNTKCKNCRKSRIKWKSSISMNAKRRFKRTHSFRCSFRNSRKKGLRTWSNRRLCR